MVTCGDGNARVVRTDVRGNRRIYWGGHQTRTRRSAFGMYVGVVRWADAGQPKVGSIFRR